MTSLLLDTKLDPQQRELTKIIRSSGESLLGIINDILDFSKIESGQLELKTEAFPLADCIESVFDLFAPKTVQKGLDLLYENDDRAPREIRGDVTRLRQILVNLVSNAIKFTEKGEILVSVGVIHEIDGARHLHFRVADTGIGIPPEARTRLFKPFSQVDTSTTRRYGDTGLGLAISRRLTKLMGGRMWVESEPGKGSTFHFTLCVEWVPSGPRRYTPESAATLRSRRALVEDDNATNRRILHDLAARWDLQTICLPDAPTALARVHAGERFNLAILDMQMPEMDGAQLARALGQTPAGARLPLVLLSSLGHSLDADTRALFAAILTKPAKPALLHQTLLRVLGATPPSPAESPDAPWIIALTANAMKGDRKACLAADMNDYVGKPMRNPELAAALERTTRAHPRHI